MKQKTPPDQGGASELFLSVADKKNYGASREELQAAFVATRYFIPVIRARLISELAFGTGGHA